MKSSNLIPKIAKWMGALVIFGVIVSSFEKPIIKDRTPDKQILNDSDFYNRFKEPLDATIFQFGQTLHAEEMGQQVVEYSFGGWVSDLPYKIFFTRNIPYEDCAGCLGDWRNGSLSPPSYCDTVNVSLQEFVAQMIFANGESESIGAAGNYWDDYRSNYIWKYETLKGSFNKITAVRKDSSRRWEAYVE